MKRKLINIFALLILVLALSIPVLASTVSNKVLSLPANQVWVTGGTVNRTGDYSYVGARLHSVYPDSGTDLFISCQCNIKNVSGTTISSYAYVSLYESSSGYSNITIREGYLNTKAVIFVFRGSTSSAANAVVSFTGN